MAAFEEFVHVEHSSALSFEQSAGKLCCANPVRTRAVQNTFNAQRHLTSRRTFRVFPRRSFPDVASC
jgi:hypothetical protein